jgi:hypothetical protein
MNVLKDKGFYFKSSNYSSYPGNIKSRNCLLFASTWLHPRVSMRSVLVCWSRTKRKSSSSSNRNVTWHKLYNRSLVVNYSLTHSLTLWSEYDCLNNVSVNGTTYMLYANSSVMYIIVCKIMILYFYYYIVHVYLIFTVLSLSVVLKPVFNIHSIITQCGFEACISLLS